jgi:hypothetical protein
MEVTAQKGIGRPRAAGAAYAFLSSYIKKQIIISDILLRKNKFLLKYFSSTNNLKPKIYMRVTLN